MKQASIAYNTSEGIFRFLGFRRPPSSANFLLAKRVLVVRLDDIGDLVMMSPFLRELRRNLPDAWITLVVKPTIYNLVELCPYINEVLTYDCSTVDPFSRLRLHFRTLGLALKHLWKRRFDLALLPRWDVDFYHGRFVTYFSGAARRVGYSHDNIAAHAELVHHSGRLFTEVLLHPKPGHEVQRNLDMIRFLGGTVQEEQLEFWLDPQDKVSAERMLRSRGYHPGEPLFAISPGKLHAKRRWPASDFAVVGQWLEERYAGRIVIIGGLQEEALGRELERHLARSINVVGQTTLRQTGALLSYCRLYIGNDSGPKHIAAAMGVPVVEINAHPLTASSAHPDSPLRFGPWRVPHRVLQPPRPVLPCVDACSADRPHCILSIRVETVKDAISELLNENSQTYGKPHS